MFGLFIVSCGFTHFMELVTMNTAVYRLSGLVKLATAVVSWATVFALFPLLPRALALRGPEELEREIRERVEAEQQLAQAKAELERRVEERTADLERANAALQKEIAQRDRARADAEAANRIKDEFLATLSHELRTPLNAMLGWVHLIRGGRIDEATQARGLEVLERSTHAQARLIDDLLDVSAIINGQLRLDVRLVDLAPVIESSLGVIRPAAAAKEITLDVALEPGAGPVSGDATRLQQVAWNLLSNAVKFTPRGGRIEVRLARAGNSAELSVSDDGQGISPEVLPYVFDRFRQADSSSTRRHGGLGLGLAIVRHLVELHGGEVTAHSDGEGKGSTFRVRLPVLAVRVEPAAPVIASDVLAGVRVLVIDDEPDARELLRLVLSAGGAEVTTAAGAPEALEMLSRVRPHVVVSDLGMPGIDGYAMLRQMRSRPAHEGGRVPAVALTAYARSEDRTRATAAGFQMHATKPINPDELVAIVKSLAALAREEGA